MILRPYQKNMVEQAKAALLKHGNTLAVAPTGAGKTIILGALASSMRKNIDGPVCVLQHRDELVGQNRDKFLLTNPNAKTTLVNAAAKDWRGDSIFAMVQTLSRPENLRNMPPLGMLIIDEAHHAIADSYLRIVDAALDVNPNCKIAGFTATPARGDGRGLRPIFSNCCGQISLHHLISTGHLVRPRTFICELTGVGERLEQVRKTKSGEFDMQAVEEVLDVEVHNSAVVQEWKKIAANRQTIVFCSTVKHAAHVTESFQAGGVKAALISGEMPANEREQILKDFDAGKIQLICNVAVLTEGYDSQPVSCIILLRPCSLKSTMVQMIGRGLRTVDPEKYPGISKRDCIVMDFGRSLLTHGDFESKVRLDDTEKQCLECGAFVPRSANECPICGHEFKGDGKEVGLGQQEKELVSSVEMLEVDILNASPFKWIDLFASNKVMIASGFDVWCAVCSRDAENWVALGKKRDEKFLHVLAKGERIPALAAADDFLRLNEDDGAAKKNKRWLNDLASMRQLELLSRQGYGPEEAFAFTKYSAACALNFHWHKRLIEAELFAA